MIRMIKPNNRGSRKMSVTDYSFLSKKKPEKNLIVKLQRSFGRDGTGQISTRHKGGGEKKKYRLISNLNLKFGLKAVVEAVEYDPFRSSFIGLVKFEGGTKAYIIAWEGMKVKDEVTADDKAELKTGNRLRLENIQNGIMIHDIELRPGQGGKMVRSAGSSATIVAKEGDYVHLKMPSGEIRKVLKKCFASLGQVSNITHSSLRIGKAGRKRHMGIRPTVRGKAMHPDAHPHGGGEGVNSIGLKYPKTPWGKHALGVRTRKKDKYSKKFIVKRRAK